MNNKRMKIKEMRDFLHAFNVVSMRGEKIDNGYELQGVRAWHDIDGYTCWLRYSDLTVTLYFHGKYLFEYKDENTLKCFGRKIEQLLQSGHK